MSLQEKVERILLPLEDTELILLKGHLLLEEAINDLLKSHLNDSKNFKHLRMGFEQRVRLLSCFQPKSFVEGDGVENMLELNRVRNALAHQVEFDDFRDRLGKWACSVLEYSPKTLNRNKTYRNTVVKALSLLIGYYQGCAAGRRAVSDQVNQPS